MKAPVCYSHPTMKMLRIAAIETVRELGINVSTVLTVIVGIGIWFIVAVTLSTSETNSVKAFALLLLDPIAGPTSVVVVFLLRLSWSTSRVAKRERSVRAHLRMSAEVAASVDDRIKSFLHNSLVDSYYGVATCYAFGSVIGQYPTRDVDIIIQFDSSKQHEVRIYRDRLRSVEIRFQDFHGLQLHVQTFLSGENEALHSFLGVSGMHERII